MDMSPPLEYPCNTANQSQTGPGDRIEKAKAKKEKSTLIPNLVKHPIIVLSDIKLQQHKLGRPTRLSTRRDPGRHSIWEKANPNYIYGEPLL